MTSIRQLAAFLALTLVLRGAPRPPPVAARHALDLLLASRFSEFARLLTPAASAKLTPEFLRDHVGPELKGFGGVEVVNTPIVGTSVKPPDQRPDSFFEDIRQREVHAGRIGPRSRTLFPHAR